MIFIFSIENTDHEVLSSMSFLMLIIISLRKASLSDLVSPNFLGNNIKFYLSLVGLIINSNALEQELKRVFSISDFHELTAKNLGKENLIHKFARSMSLKITQKTERM